MFFVEENGDRIKGKLSDDKGSRILSGGVEISTVAAAYCTKLLEKIVFCKHGLFAVSSKTYCEHQRKWV
jgi:GMP synthase PP-ATPase subunit